jgi:hypothetical protein
MKIVIKPGSRRGCLLFVAVNNAVLLYCFRSFFGTVVREEPGYHGRARVARSEFGARKGE